MELKDLLGEEVYATIEEKVKDKHIIIADSKDAFIPKQRLNDVITQRDELKTMTDALAQDVESLKGSEGTVEELKTKLSELSSNHTKTIDEYNGKIVTMQKDYAIDLALREAGARNAKAVKALLDAKSINVSENGIVGLKEQLESIKAENDFLFNPKPKIPGADNGNVPPPKSQNNPFAKGSLNLIEQMKLFKDNPALAEKLQLEASK